MILAKLNYIFLTNLKIFLKKTCKDIFSKYANLMHHYKNNPLDAIKLFEF